MDMATLVCDLKNVLDVEKVFCPDSAEKVSLSECVGRLCRAAETISEPPSFPETFEHAAAACNVLGIEAVREVLFR